MYTKYTNKGLEIHKQKPKSRYVHACNSYVSLSERSHFRVSSVSLYSDFKPLRVCQQEGELHDNSATWLPYKRSELLSSVFQAKEC